ncbi:MAG: tRNA uridine-5-carboxymethylaminomethyl(34) synthesis enzyme MnmG [Bacteroidales bacterium]|nr:tRNA uridine-5-carboxymethylaminomethyl(34) synthesis enzyme MnmG [Bacteroidales bacterium]
MTFNYDIIVVGGGHAGCEGAIAAARLGAKTLLITADMNRVGQMSCNPAIGGIAKGQIVREIDALGGVMGLLADRTAVQFRMLNRSKGPAVWSPRVQSDRTAYIDEMRKTLDSVDNLSIYQDSVMELIVNEEDDNEGGVVGTVVGVVTSLGVRFYAPKVILTAGTFLNGLMHFGRTQIPGGRISEIAESGITAQLRTLGFETDRMKTGTPARIDGNSIDMSKVVVQSGDDTVDENGEISRDFHKFSFMPDSKRVLKPRDCYIVHTSPEVHRILNDNLADSPLYNGQIKSIGPRYCPSIETKIVTFADKDSHQLFLEPEGETTREFYINGFSSSLPWKVQMDALSKVEGLDNVHFYRPGYAIEYDFFPPTQLTHDLQTKLVKGLYFAGQVNGTTGYEEAAAQGLMAGINAALSVKGEEPLVLRRDEAYIGVLIDDLVTKGVDEPYRMFTSRAEYRILLRQDDADMRLTPIGYRIGLASQARYDAMIEKLHERDALIGWCRENSLKVSDENNRRLSEFGTSPMKVTTKFYELIKRPQLNFEILAQVSDALEERIAQIPAERCSEIVEAAEILIKYEGYIEREQEIASKITRLEYVKLNPDFDYNSVNALSTEARQKLSRLRPVSIGQASRIPGVSPADINILLLLCGR